MIVQEFTLPRYRWRVRVYYSVTTCRAGEIAAALRDIGCGGEQLAKAVRNLSESRPDTGLTYSNFASRETVVVTSLASSPAQFLNSWTHEMFHLCRHVAQACGIDPYGEEAAYLAGTVAQKMFPVAGKLLCNHCRRDVEVGIINDRKSRLWHTAHTSTS